MRLGSVASLPHVGTFADCDRCEHVFGVREWRYYKRLEQELINAE